MQNNRTRAKRYSAVDARLSSTPEHAPLSATETGNQSSRHTFSSFPWPSYQSTGSLYNHSLMRRARESVASGTSNVQTRTESWIGSIGRSGNLAGLVLDNRRSSTLAVNVAGSEFLPRQASLYECNTPATNNAAASTPIAYGIAYGDDLLLNGGAAVAKSSFAQTTFNCVHLFIGVGLLSLPYTFRIGGWPIGIATLVFGALLSRYTTIKLLKCMDLVGAYTYSDLGESCFGRPGRIVVTSVLFGELFSCCCAFIVLIGDTLSYILLLSGMDENSLGWFSTVLGMKTIAFIVVLLPTTLTGNLKVLSIGSIIGICASFALGGIMLADAIGKPEAPGSIWESAPTDLYPTTLRNWMLLPINVGLVMYNFSGAAVIPNLYRDMADPEKVYKMLNLTFTIVTSWFLAMCSLGYYMFGSTTLEEITFNIAQEPSYNKALTLFLLWLIVLNPLTKFALLLQPICQNLELTLIRPLFLPTDGATPGEIQGLLASDDNDGYERSTPSKKPVFKSVAMFRTMQLLLRAAIATLAFIVGVFYPSFNNLLAFIGTFFSFSVSAVFPCVAYLYLFCGRLHWTEVGANWVIVVLSASMVVAGLAWMPVVDLVAPDE